MFDLIGGTSTGGILAIALGVKDYNMTQLDAIYSDLGKKACPGRSTTGGAEGPKQERGEGGRLRWDGPAGRDGLRGRRGGRSVAAIKCLQPKESEKGCDGQSGNRGSECKQQGTWVSSTRAKGGRGERLLLRA